MVLFKQRPQMRLGFLLVADPIESFSALKLVDQGLKDAVGTAAVARDDKRSVAQRIEQDGMQLVAMLLRFIVRVEKDQAVALTVQVHDRWRDDHRRIARGRDAEIIYRRLNSKERARPFENHVEIHGQHSADEAIGDHLSQRDRPPVDLGFFEIGADQVPAFVDRQQRHAGPVEVPVTVG